jgi:hypothetical protein
VHCCGVQGPAPDLGLLHANPYQVLVGQEAGRPVEVGDDRWPVGAQDVVDAGHLPQLRLQAQFFEHLPLGGGPRGLVRLTAATGDGEGMVQVVGELHQQAAPPAVAGENPGRGQHQVIDGAAPSRR